MLHQAFWEHFLPREGGHTFVLVRGSPFQNDFEVFLSFEKVTFFGVSKLSFLEDVAVST